jgi:mannosyltransferase
MSLAAALEPALGRKPVSVWDRITVFYPWVVVALLVAAAALLRFHALGDKSVWVDEGVSIEMARLNWYNFLRILWRHEANMAFYTLLLRFWLVAGDGEAWIRTLSVISAVATIPAVYVLGRKLFDRRVGLMAAFLLTTNAFHVRYSQEARGYSLFALLTVLSSIYFVNALEDRSEESSRAHVITSGLAVYTHFFAALLVLVEWLSLKWLEPRRVEATMKNNWRQIALVVSPLVLFVATTGFGVLRWIPRPTWRSLYITGIFLTGGGPTRLLWLYLAAGGLAILPTFPKFFHFGRVGWNVWRCRFLSSWLLVPILTVFAISQWKPCFLARYFIFTLPALALLGAAGIARLRWRLAIGAALLLFAAWSLPAVDSLYQRDFDIAREDFRAATRYVLAGAQPGDAIVFHQPIGRMPYEYYRSLTPASAYPTVIYPEHGDHLTFKDFYAAHPSDQFLERAAEEHRRIWVVFTYNQLPTGPDPTTRLVDWLFPKVYRTVETKTFPGVEVALYAR